MFPRPVFIGSAIGAGAPFIAENSPQGASDMERDINTPPSRTAVDSASDERTANNAMRHQYRVLSDAEKAAMVAIKDKGAELLSLIERQDTPSGASGRCYAIARTKTEEAIMWAVKGLTG